MSAPYCEGGAVWTKRSMYGRASAARPCRRKSFPRLKSVSHSLGFSSTARFQCAIASSGWPVSAAITPSALCARDTSGSSARASSRIARAAALVQVGAEEGGGVGFLGVEGDRVSQGGDRAVQIARFPLQERKVHQGQWHVGSLLEHTLDACERSLEVAGLVEGHNLLDGGVESDQSLGIVVLGVLRLAGCGRAHIAEASQPLAGLRALISARDAPVGGTQPRELGADRLQHARLRGGKVLH